MKKRVAIFSVVAVLLLAAAVAAGLNAVFTVSSVVLEADCFSEAARADAAALQTDLDAFRGRSTTLLDLAEVRATAERYPYLRVEEIGKEYPQTVSLRVSERRETFAAGRSDGRYDLFDDRGAYLGVSETNANRADGARNILIDGFDGFGYAAEPSSEGNGLAALLAVAARFGDDVCGARTNLLSVSLRIPLRDDPRTEYLEIVTAEGACYRIVNPSYRCEEKAEIAARHYFGLSDGERVYGRYEAFDLIDAGGISVQPMTGEE